MSPLQSSGVRLSPREENITCRQQQPTTLEESDAREFEIEADGIPGACFAALR